jgi:hypothetical protein
MLASGLPDIAGDDEDLARFLTSSSQFNAQGAKPAAFLPSRYSHETSVFRHGIEPRGTLWAIGDKDMARDCTIYGAAIVKVRDVKAARLQVTPFEPPPRHAAIRGWIRHYDDPVLQKAMQKEQAVQVASKAIFVRR